MGMTKHANTIFPGDKVAVRGVKIASADAGKVADATSHNEQGELLVRVDWPDGRHTYESPERLEKL